MNGRGLAALREFARKAPEPERCELCSATIAARHSHLVEIRTRRLVCACEPCAILFSGNAETPYRRVPRDARYVPDFALSDQTWNSLGIPIGLVFLYRSSASGRVLAVYPSPAGPTETAVEEASWEELAADNPALRKMTADVEALLVNRMNGARQYYLAPIDQCYRLTGIVRKYWRGFSGGEEGWAQIRKFFAELRGSYAGSVV